MPSILVTVDDTPSTIAARSLAIALARQCGARIRGVTGLELADLEQIEAFPAGGAQHAYDRLQHREKRATERRVRIADLPELFRQSLAEAGLETDCPTLEGDVRSGLLAMIETCDLIVTGRDTEFHLEPSDGLTPLVEHMIAKGSRPVVVSGPEPPASGPVLVAYDGSAPSAKALQMATLTGMFGDAGAHLVSVSRDRPAATVAAARARSFLEGHGIVPEVEAIGSTVHPAVVLMKRASEIGARMLVMGAFGHRGFREILFGSTTRRLFDEAPLPLFIHH